MANKLIIVEGLPSSGKSTTAQLVYNILKDDGLNVELYSEGNYNHPADYDGVAYFDNDGFNALKQNHPQSSELLDQIKALHFEGYLIPYRKAVEAQHYSFDELLFHDITKKDIYELPLDIHKRLIFDRWRQFVENHADEDKYIIFECCFIQNPITVCMIKNNSVKDVTMNYIQTLEEIIAPLNPLLIYVEQKDIRTSFSKAISERPSEWFEGFKDYYTNQGYGLHHNLSEFEGVIQILETRSALEHEVYDALKLTKFRIDNSKFDVDLLKEKVNSATEKIGD